MTECFLKLKKWSATCYLSTYPAALSRIRILSTVSVFLVYSIQSCHDFLVFLATVDLVLDTQFQWYLKR